jgi:hypothetical protein
MSRTHTPAVSPTEEDLIVLAGPRPGTALRVRVEPGVDGYVRLEHLAYSAGIGWYTQKSFTIPGEMLAAIVPQLRKADCMIPKRPHDEPRLTIGPALDDRPTRLQRREA